jgi:F0F1-type ATP synthase membrane subunit b/b'
MSEHRRKEDSPNGKLIYWGKIAGALTAIGALIFILGSFVWTPAKNFEEHKIKNINDFHDIEKQLIKISAEQDKANETINKIYEKVK